jgi:iron(III) transport system permease protein
MPRRIALTGTRGGAVAGALFLPVALGFAAPAAVLVEFAARRLADQDLSRFLDHAANSLILSGLAAAIAVAIGVFLAHAGRVSRSGAVRLASTAASVGYAVPGAVLAIGILVPLARFDEWASALSAGLVGLPTGAILSGTMFAIVYAYVVRFMAVSYGSIDAGFARLSPNLHLAARSLGRGPVGALLTVQLPLLRPAILSAGLLVFVDSMKELPATILLRPFGFDTLATHVYTFASLAIVEEAALSALAIVAVGVVPVLVLSRAMAPAGWRAETLAAGAAIEAGEVAAAGGTDLR